MKVKPCFICGHQRRQPFLHTNVVYAEACITSSSTRLPLPKLTNMLLSGGFWRISTIGHQIGNWQLATDWPTDLCGREGVRKLSAIVIADTEDTQSDLQAEAENADAEMTGADDEAAGPLDGEVVEGGAVVLDAEMPIIAELVLGLTP